MFWKIGLGVLAGWTVVPAVVWIVIHEIMSLVRLFLRGPDETASSFPFQWNAIPGSSGESVISAEWSDGDSGMSERRVELWN